MKPCHTKSYRMSQTTIYSHLRDSITWYIGTTLGRSQSHGANSEHLGTTHHRILCPCVNIQATETNNNRADYDMSENKIKVI